MHVMHNTVMTLCSGSVVLAGPFALKGLHVLCLLQMPRPTFPLKIGVMAGGSITGMLHAVQHLANM